MKKCDLLCAVAIMALDCFSEPDQSPEQAIEKILSEETGQLQEREIPLHSAELEYKKLNH